MALKVLKVPGNAEFEGGSRAPSMPMIQVWDLTVRFIHWASVLCFAGAWFSAGSNAGIHELAGYTLAGLLAVRIWWGFAGTRHARFSDFVPAPRQLIAYLRSMAAGRSKRHVGHNPAGAVMILALVALLAVICATGWMMLTRRFFGVAWVEHVHNLAAYAVVALLPLHIGGALFSSFVHKENLIWAMVTGRKRPMHGYDPAATARLLRDNMLDRLKAMEAFALTSVIVIASMALWYNFKPPGKTKPVAKTVVVVQPVPEVVRVVRPTEVPEVKPAAESGVRPAPIVKAPPVRSAVAAFANVVIQSPDSMSPAERLSFLLCRQIVIARPMEFVKIFDMVGLFHPTVIRELQLLMKDINIFDGTFDGVAGPKTLAAMSRLANNYSDPSICGTG